MDHHCEWLGCCVAYYNMKMYIHVLANTGIVCGVVLVRDVMAESWWDVGVLARLTVVGFAGYEIVRMGWYVAKYVSGNQTLVESYKQVRGPRVAIQTKLREVFGEDFGIDWFLPSYVEANGVDFY